MTERRPTSPIVRRCGALASVAVGSFMATANADRPKTVLDLQPFRATESIAIRSPSQGEGTATLVNLNPTIGVWYVLEIAWTGGGPPHTYHLEVARPFGLKLVLDQHYPIGLGIVEGQRRHTCDLLSEISPDRVEHARAPGSLFHPLC